MLNFGDCLTIGMIIMIYVIPMGIDHSGFFISFIIRSLFALLTVAMMIVPCGWIRRYKSQKKRDYLLSLPTQNAVGTIPLSFEITRSQYGYVPAGYSMKSDGDAYFHYAPGTIYTSTGRYRAYANIGNERILLESLPKKFGNKKTVIPTFHNPVRISYVTDKDGTNYFVTASQN